MAVVGTNTIGFHAAEKFIVNREGIDLLQFFFSFSGCILTEGTLSTLNADWDGDELIIHPPIRLGNPSFRPIPQLDHYNFSRFFNGGVPAALPLQIAAFPGFNSSRGSSSNIWLGPSMRVDPNAPKLPEDTILISLKGTKTDVQAAEIEKQVLNPILERLRIESRQWWIGRSTEGVTGKLHFVAMLDHLGKFVRNSIPVTKCASASARMKPIDDAMWQMSARLGITSKIDGSLSLQSDAEYLLASGEHRIGIILACCAIEAARDEVLHKSHNTLNDLKTSNTDLLKQMTLGFKTLYGRDLKLERPDLYNTLKAFWIARGEAAHGKRVIWRGEPEMDLADIPFGLLHDSLDAILKWIQAIKLNIRQA